MVAEVISKQQKKEAAAMKKFAKQFSKEEWGRCCKSKTFMDAVVTDLVAAERVASLILTDKWTEPEEDLI